MSTWRLFGNTVCNVGRRKYSCIKKKCIKQINKAHSCALYLFAPQPQSHPLLTHPPLRPLHPVHLPCLRYSFCLTKKWGELRCALVNKKESTYIGTHSWTREITKQRLYTGLYNLIHVSCTHLPREQRRAIVGWQAGHNHSPSGMR